MATAGHNRIVDQSLQGCKPDPVGGVSLKCTTPIRVLLLRAFLRATPGFPRLLFGT